MKAVSIRWSVVSLILTAMLFALCFSAEAQQPKKIPRIGYLSPGDANGSSASVEPFRQGMRELGYVERKNILIEYRYAEGKLDRIPSLVGELVQLKPEVPVVISLLSIRAAKQATKTIPIIIMSTQDPVASGIIDSLAHPGGNITGVVRLTRELSGKRLELLKEAVPRMSRVAVLWNPNDSGTSVAFKEYQAAAPALKIQLQSLEVRDPNPDLEGAFQAAAKERANALITITNPVLSRYVKRISDLAISNRLPSMYERIAWVEAGGLLSYSANDADSFRRAAYYVDRILKGVRPADLPVEQPTKFELVINLKTAKEIGVLIPEKLLARADRVIK